MDLLPIPRSVEPRDGVCNVPEAITREINRAIPPQGYRLSVRADGVTIVGGDAAGQFYAMQTLAQLVENGVAPCVEIEDAPELAVRGVMLDVSRDKVPTMATLKSLIDLLASWKINQFQLYTEHTFAYAQHREVWADASPLTAEEIRELDAYCRERFVELVPNQNSFGHLERWFMHERYRSLAETPGGITLPWGEVTKFPFTLAPTAEGLAFLDGLYGELLPNFTSTQFNVDCDETYDLGLGVSKQRVDAVGRPRVWLDFVREIRILAARHGKTVQVWGDTVRRHPELFADLPRDITILDWGYDAERSLDQTSERLAAAGQPFYVCPGTSSWTSLTGRTDNAIANILDAVECAQRFGAKGVLLTDWGDGGHWQQLPVSYLGYAWSAALSWSLSANRSIDLPRALDRFAFHDATGTLGRLAWDLGNTYLKPGFRRGNSSILYWFYTETFAGMRANWQTFIRYGPEVFQDDNAVRRGMHETIEWIESVCTPLSRVDDELVRREFAHGAALARHAARRVLVELGEPGREALEPELDAIVAEHIALWPRRNRRGGLTDSARKLIDSKRLIR